MAAAYFFVEICGSTGRGAALICTGGRGMAGDGPLLVEMMVPPLVELRITAPEG
jgi:hypothetical protein